MSTPDIMLSPHCILRYDAGCPSDAPFAAYAVRVVLFRWLRRYRLVMTELCFQRLWLCLKPTFKIQKPQPNLLNSGPKVSTTYQLVVMPIPALNYFAINNYGLYGFRLLMRDSKQALQPAGKAKRIPPKNGRETMPTVALPSLRQR